MTDFGERIKSHPMGFIALVVAAAVSSTWAFTKNVVEAKKDAEISMKDAELSSLKSDYNKRINELEETAIMHFTKQEVGGGNALACGLNAPWRSSLPSPSRPSRRGQFSC